jgi:putative N6-adenine-specific DNA methylase
MASNPSRYPSAPRRPAPLVRNDTGPMLFLNCGMGIEPLLTEEARRILDGRCEVEAARGGVTVRSDSLMSLLDATFRLNLESRLAQRVLWRVGSRIYRHEDDLYSLARSVDWSIWITPEHTLRVDVIARNSPLRSINFAGLRIKDAVCDDLRERMGERPSVDTRFPDLSLLLYVDDLEATLYVDTSGEALFKRGWREDTGEAPLKETLAAAMLAAAGWQGRPEDGALLDPCCGAGTIPIEAAQIACNIAPGLQRRFAFEKLLPFRPHLAHWQSIKQAARNRQRAPQVAIYAGDVAFRMTDFATRNAERAGVRHAIEFKTADALQRPVPAPHGVMMFNPPYGERIDTKGTAGRTYQARQQWQSGDDDGDERGNGHDAYPGRPRQPEGKAQSMAPEDASFFQALASHWKKNYTGWTAWILSPDMSLPGAMRLKESRRTVLYNGPIECRLFRFDLVAGSNKRRPAEAATEPGVSAPSGDPAVPPAGGTSEPASDPQA